LTFATRSGVPIGRRRRKVAPFPEMFVGFRVKFVLLGRSIVEIFQLFPILCHFYDFFF
jgi:hypothetical protein